MPCDGGGLDPSNRQIEISRVATFLDELYGIPFNEEYSKGFHPKAYKNLTRTDIDDMVASLCDRLNEIGDISGFSLEMQIWWRDHQIWDRARRRTEEENQAKMLLREQALSKLTSEEIEILGLST